MPTKFHSGQGYKPSETIINALKAIRDSQAKLYDELVVYMNTPLQRWKQETRQPVPFLTLSGRNIKIDHTNTQIRSLPKFNASEYQSMSVASGFFSYAFKYKILGTRIGEDNDVIDPTTGLIKRMYPPNQERFKTHGRIKNLSQVRDALYEILVKEPEFFTNTTIDNVIAPEMREVFTPLAEKLIGLSITDRDQVMNSIDRLAGPCYDVSKQATNDEYPSKASQTQDYFQANFIDSKTISQIMQFSKYVLGKNNDNVIDVLRQRRQWSPPQCSSKERLYNYDTNVIQHHLKGITPNQILQHATNWYRGNRFGYRTIVFKGPTKEFSVDKVIKVDGQIFIKSTPKQSGTTVKTQLENQNRTTAQTENVQHVENDQHHVDHSLQHYDVTPPNNGIIFDFIEIIGQATNGKPCKLEPSPVEINAFTLKDNEEILPYVKAFLETTELICNMTTPEQSIPNYKYGSQVLNTGVEQERSNLGTAAKYTDIDPIGLVKGNLRKEFHSMQAKFMQENFEFFTQVFYETPNAENNINWQNPAQTSFQNQATEVTQALSRAIAQDAYQKANADIILKFKIATQIANDPGRKQNLEKLYADNLKYTAEQLYFYQSLNNQFRETKNLLSSTGTSNLEVPEEDARNKNEFPDGMTCSRSRKRTRGDDDPEFEYLF